MRKTVYAKYSRERSEKFQISTTICEENGQRYVEKRALKPESCGHVEKLVENGARLEQIYRYPGLKICPCKAAGKGTVQFSYVEGKNMDQLLSEHVLGGDFEQVKKDVTALYEILCSSKGLAPFAVSEEFKQIFGELELREGLMAAPVSNLDMLFSNILVQEQLYLTDYEWVFDFMIPISFLFARSLMLHGTLQTLPKEQLEELYAIGGVKPEEISTYYQMEVQFQKYVTGEDEANVLSRLYPKMKTCCYFLDYWNTKHVYYGVQILGIPKGMARKTAGKAAGEQDTEQVTETSGEPVELFYSLHFQGEVEETVSIPDTEKYEAFLFRPVDTECVLKMHYFEGWKDCGAGLMETGAPKGQMDGAKMEAIAFDSHNAQLVYGDAYHFAQAPEVRIENKGYRQLHFGYIVWHRDHFLIQEEIQVRQENEALHKELRKYTGRLHNRVLRKIGRLIKRN